MPNDEEREPQPTGAEPEPTTPLEVVEDAVSQGTKTPEYRGLQQKLRWVAAFGFMGGLLLDRFGPVLFDRWQQYSDWGLLVMVAAVLVLLGERTVAALFERMRR